MLNQARLKETNMHVTIFERPKMHEIWTKLLNKLGKKK